MAIPIRRAAAGRGARRLLRLVGNADVVVELRLGPGVTLLAGHRTAVIHGTAVPALDPEISTSPHVGTERTFEQEDAGPALRVQAGIALCGRSAAIKAPTTAVYALDAIDSLLHTLVMRYLGIGARTDSRRRLRVLLTLPSWEDDLRVAGDEIISMRSNSLQVGRRVDWLRSDLALIAPAERRSAVQTRLDQRHGTDPAPPEQPP